MPKMTTDDINSNPEIHEQTEEAPVTREAFLATAFVEDFFDRFAEAELSEDQLFLMSVTQDFDKWLVKMELLPADHDDDYVHMRGKGAIRQETRAMINRAASHGKTVWPPFSIAASKKGVNYEVRLMSRHLEKIPADMAIKLKVYIENKLAHWNRIGNLMHSEKVKKYAPEQYLKFMGVKWGVDVMLKGIVADITRLNLELISHARDTTQFLASLPKDDDTQQLQLHYRIKEEEPVDA
jgi:hypothetical protein